MLNGMVSVFFYCRKERIGFHKEKPIFIHRTIIEVAIMIRFLPRESSSMDINKLFEKVMASHEVEKVPIFYVLIVMNCVIEAISSGECFYDTEYE